MSDNITYQVKEVNGKFGNFKISTISLDKYSRQ